VVIPHKLSLIPPVLLQILAIHCCYLFLLLLLVQAQLLDPRVLLCSPALLLGRSRVLPWVVPLFPPSPLLVLYPLSLEQILWRITGVNV
jgi:hypothetical protein